MILLRELTKNRNVNYAKVKAIITPFSKRAASCSGASEQRHTVLSNNQHAAPLRALLKYKVKSESRDSSLACSKTTNTLEFKLWILIFIMKIICLLFIVFAVFIETVDARWDRELPKRYLRQKRREARLAKRNARNARRRRRMLRRTYSRGDSVFR